MDLSPKKCYNIVVKKNKNNEVMYPMKIIPQITVFDYSEIEVWV